MMRSVLLVLCLYGLFGSALAAQPPVIRTEISPRSVVVGQTVTLRVDIFVPTWFTAPIEYPSSIAVAGATAQLSDSAATNLTEHIDGQSYAGMSRSYTVVAQRAGDFQIPMLPINISYSLDGKPRMLTLQTTPQNFRATLPSGAEALGYFFASPAYSIKQSIDRPLTKLKVGDAIVRRITQRASAVAAMNLPALTFAALDDGSIYPAEAQLNDSGGERGSMRVGERIDSVTYVLRKAGPYELPSLKVAWFDTIGGKMRWASVPALRFDVVPDPRAVASVKPSSSVGDGVSPAPTDDFSLRRMLLNFWRHPLALTTASVLMPLLLVAYALKRRGINLARVWQAWQQRRRDAEPAHFQRCLASLRQATVIQALNATMQWLNQLKRNGSSASLTQFAVNFGDDDFRQQVTYLQSHLFAKNKSPIQWNAVTYQRALVRARQRWLRAQKTSTPGSDNLAALNPISS